MVSKNTICLLYGGSALDATTFYSKTFPNRAVCSVDRAPRDIAKIKTARRG